MLLFNALFGRILPRKNAVEYTKAVSICRVIYIFGFARIRNSTPKLNTYIT